MSTIVMETPTASGDIRGAGSRRVSTLAESDCGVDQAAQPQTASAAKHHANRIPRFAEEYRNKTPSRKSNYVAPRAEWLARNAPIELKIVRKAAG
ncbi:MAG: hypothetical protein R3C99_21990 [Pirellulaceae bacterium]